MTSKSWAILACVALVTGCAAPPAPPPVPQGPDPAEVVLEQGMQRAQPRRLDADSQAPQPVYGWKSTTVDYYGDVKVFLEQVTKGLGTRFVVTGPQPHLPIFVRIQAHEEPLEEVLRRVAEQLGGRADIVMRDASIDLRYRAQQ